MSSAPTRFQLPFVKKEQQTDEVYSFFFDRSGYEFSFLPGQYIRMMLPHPEPDERGTSRFFTISSPPTEIDYLVVTTKLMQSTFKHHLLTLTAGEPVQFWGPTGQFILQESIQTPLVFLAGGIGMTPFYSMVRYAFDKNLSIPMTLFVSFSTEKEVLFYNELQEIHAQRGYLKSIFTITAHEAVTPSWQGERGRLSEELLRKYVPNSSACTYYICGPQELVEALEQMLQQMHIPDSQIILEKFSGY